ncbi:MAG: hypothetical protein Q4D16_10340 [Eubacteriales bacterium]|nr:hypothetical protein [Eubacteriales bacterium]
MNKFVNLGMISFAGILILGGLSGCGMVERIVNHNDTFSEREVVTAFPSYHKNTVENVTFKTEVKIPSDFKPEELVNATVKMKLPDMETVKKQFEEKLAGKKIKEEFNDPPTHESPFPYYSVLTEDIYSFSISRGVAYRTPLASYLYNTLVYDEQGNLPEEYRRVEEIEGMPKETVLLEAEEDMKGIGYPMDGEISCFALPHTLLEEKESWLSRDGSDESGSYKESWTKDDDMWYFLMRQTHQGLPVYHQYVYPDCNDQNAPIRIAYSRRGLESLEVDYYFEFEKQEEPLYLAVFDKIAETAAGKYNDLLTDAEYIVTKATLYQAVVQENSKEYRVTPAWLLDIEENTQETSYYFTMLIDAVTGEEIIS